MMEGDVDRHLHDGVLPPSQALQIGELDACFPPLRVTRNRLSGRTPNARQKFYEFP